MGQYRKGVGGGFSGLKENGQFLNAPPPVSLMQQQPGMVCSCSRFLNPYPATAAPSANGTNPNLQHFCRVCNIRLNSCRQSRIHADGKKHIKHLHYLKTCVLEANSSRKDALLPRYVAEPPTNTNHFSNYAPAAAGGIGGGAPPMVAHTPMSSSSSYPNAAICQIQFANCPGNAFLYHTLPPPQPQPQAAAYMPFLPCPAGVFPSYQDLQNSLLQQQLQHQLQQQHQLLPSPMMGPPPSAHYQAMGNNNLMSPSLTSSGFSSGSGADCKSMETGSILSTSSSSNLPPVYSAQHQQQFHHYSQKTRMSVNNRNQLVWCRLCHMSFPSQQMLDSHLAAVRHTRKTMDKNHVSLPNLGANVVAATGNEIKCQVCQVSVNSSQQLVAHLAGQKHRIRAVRQGLKSDQALASPSSSTLTSASESEHGYPIRGINDHGGQQQQQQPKLRRRSSDFNLFRHHQQSGCNGGLGLRQRCYTTCGGGGGISVASHTLNRYLSSSCLNRVCSRSTTSLRKAVSHTALHKCRSMNLLNGSSARKKRVEEEEDLEDDDEEEVEDLKSPWSRGGNENSSSDQEEMQATSTSEEEYYRNQNFRQDKALNTAAAAKSINKLNARLAAEPASTVQCQRHMQQQQPESKDAKQRSQPGFGRKHSSNYGSGGGNSASFMEIPMLNVFLQRLNQHSLRKKKTVVKAQQQQQQLNESDFSNNDN